MDTNYQHQSDHTTVVQSFDEPIVQVGSLPAHGIDLNGHKLRCQIAVAQNRFLLDGRKHCIPENGSARERFGAVALLIQVEIVAQRSGERQPGDQDRCGCDVAERGAEFPANQKVKDAPDDGS